MDANSIKEDSKRIMNNFMDAMKDVEVENDFILEREKCFREEGEGNEVDEDFKQRFLSNAKKTSGEAVLANKGDWV